MFPNSVSSVRINIRETVAVIGQFMQEWPMFIITMQIKPIPPQSLYKPYIQFVTLIKPLFGIQLDGIQFEIAIFS